MKFLIVLCFALVTSLCYGIQYQITDIGDLGVGEGGVGGHESYAYAINNLGQVAGMSRRDGGGEYAVVWTPESGLFSLNVPNPSKAVGINDAGQVIGQGMESINSFVWTKSTGAVSLPYLEPYGHNRYTAAYAINNLGQITGYCSANPASSQYYKVPMVWSVTTGYTTIDFGIYNMNPEACSINDSGQVVGTMSGYMLGSRSFRWSANSGLENLGTFGYADSMACGINNNGDIVGNVNDSTGAISQPYVLLNNGEFHTVNIPGRAIDINNSGEIVGHGFNGVNPAFRWTIQDGVQDLNQLIDPASGWQLFGAEAINESGQIVGTGRNPEGYLHGYILTPIPEPATLLLLGVGGMMLRRRCEK